MKLVKVTEIDAEQFSDTVFPYSSSANPPEYKHDPEAQIRLKGNIRSQGAWKVKTCEGWVWLRPGDWVCLLDGKYYKRADSYIRDNYQVVS